MSNITSYQAKYFAYELTRQLPSNNVGKFTASLQNAQVDLNPHQVEAALFAFKSPLSHGAILADEVGLGKTIEAGIILSQQWAEKKRKLLIICPSNLRKQWNQELLDKFFLPSMLLETKSFNDEVKKGTSNPFAQQENIVICSFQFARNKALFLQQVNWDLVIIDEAHRLRNVYKPTNKIGNALKEALAKNKKVLLTATPLQNSILELYGLVSLIDDFVFGDLKSFKSQYSSQLNDGMYGELKKRLKPVCQRTLRRQVLEYIKYTKRIAICQEFSPTEEEQQLYELVSAYLSHPKLYALPVGQRQLMTLILRKLLASSSYAISGTFATMIKRLEDSIGQNQVESALDLIAEDYDSLQETEDEWEDDDNQETIEEGNLLSDEDAKGIKNEIQELQQYKALADSINKNSKAECLFTALEKGFAKLGELGAAKKALIFTESKRTQEFLVRLLEERGYKDQVVRFDGSNNDEKSRTIYKDWLKEYKNTDRVTGSATADKRAAIVDYFRSSATIMIATEAAAEGVNLQFCSLVVNYDLPWNPQRIEQRIGRCHRYGQKHDVVVVNFLNTKNAADERVYQLLNEKFCLFEGVFGASDEVIGAIGNGVDFEKRIAQIYNTCRTSAEITTAFDQLQDELKENISEKMKTARTTLLENFDDDVRDKLRINLKESKENLNVFEQKLWQATQYYLQGKAEFSNSDYSFKLVTNPFPAESIHEGPYMILKPEEGQRKSDIAIPDDTNIYRVGHKLAQRILDSCKQLPTPTKEIVFNYTGRGSKVALLEQQVGKAGWMQVEHLSISSFEQEDYLLMACFNEAGEVIDKATAAKMLTLSATERKIVSLDIESSHKVKVLIHKDYQEIVGANADRNRDFFDDEMEKLDTWAEDMKISLEKEIKDLDAEIKLRKAEAKKLLNLEEKVKAQREIKDMEKKRSEKRQRLYVAQDEIDARKESLLTEIEQRLKQQIEQKELFTIKWRII